ncbi:unnamed protein product [Amaranthus hypochondriacus]
MGESLVETPKLDNKMGDSVTHVPCLQESVSFGRFEHDSLCWERWSTFPTNKYLEEVEKCSTPGSVAQKKAYFEAHYKKIAARKIEMMEEEKKREAESMNFEDRTLMDSVYDETEEDLDVEKTSTQNSAEELVNEVSTYSSEVTDKHVDVLCNNAEIVIEENEVENLDIEVTEHIDDQYDVDVVDEVKEEENLTCEVSKHVDLMGDEAVKKDIDEMISDVEKIKENGNIQFQSEDHIEDSCLNLGVPEVPDEPVLVKEDTASARVWQDKEVLPEDKAEEKKLADRKPKNRMESIDAMKQKKPLVKKPTYTSHAKKKPASPISKTPATPMPKSPMISTPKPSKPDLTKATKSTTRSAVKDSGYTPLTSKKAAKPESKRVFPTSLHMSLSYGPTNSDPTTRKSLIMESMGDKDIVKRAFKAFQNVRVSPSSLTTNQSATKRMEPKVSTPDTNQKKKEGIINATKAASPLTGQKGVIKTSQSLGLKKSIGVDQKHGKVVPPPFGSRSLDHGRPQKGILKKIEQKTNTKDTGKPLSKMKTEKAAEIGKPSQKINSKIKLSSSYNQGHGFLRGFVRKEDAKI